MVEVYPREKDGRVVLHDPATGRRKELTQTQAWRLAEGLRENGRKGYPASFVPLGLNCQITPSECLVFSSALWSAACDAALLYDAHQCEWGADGGDGAECCPDVTKHMGELVLKVARLSF